MAGGSRQIFISYARGDAERVDVPVESLRQLRYDAWVDQELTGGQAWWDTVLSQIRASAAVLIAVSPAALESVAVRREYEYAHAVRRPLLPVIVDRVRLELLPSLLGALQAVDYCEPGMKNALALAAALAGLPARQAVPRPLPEPPPIPISYLSGLKERSQAAALSMDEQLALIARLKAALSRASEREAAEEVLRSLQNRDDLYQVSAREIESLLSPIDRQQKAAEEAQQKAAEEAREEAQRKAREEAQRKAAEKAQQKVRKEARQTREEEARQAREEAARLGAAALEFLKTIEKLQAGENPIAFSIPTGTELGSPARREPTDQGAETGSPLQGDSVVQLGSIFENLTEQSMWTATLLKSNDFTRELRIKLSNETHTLEVKVYRIGSFRARSSSGSILLDGKPIIKPSDLSSRIHHFSLSDGQKQRDACLWIRTRGTRRIIEFKLAVDDEVLHHER